MEGASKAMGFSGLVYLHASLKPTMLDLLSEGVAHTATVLTYLRSAMQILAWGMTSPRFLRVILVVRSVVGYFWLFFLLKNTKLNSVQWIWEVFKAMFLVDWVGGR